MPSISRARIVNFRYNDGGRLIPDILLNFENSDRNTINTLLDLENGGGKSVLVQILLQPVIPNASVQKRKISEYFKKNSDYAYILLEWKLDKSTDHLLTGIAIASAQNADENDETKSVKFFTFINHYNNFGDEFDIENFPLSSKKDGKITIARFEEVRKKVKNNKKLEYFYSDDLRYYQSKIEEFGIIHSEWKNILVKINENEGGIDKFFEMYNNTDKLLDGFIIPGIIGVGNSSRNTDDNNTLENMFLNYAKSCSEKEEKIKYRDSIADFIEKLNEFHPEVKTLWDLTDKKDKAIHNIFEYLYSLKKYVCDLEKENGKIESEIVKEKDKIKHIDLEKLSYKYYTIKSKYGELNERLEIAEKEKNESQEKKKEYEHRKDVLEAAEKYEKLLEQENQKNAISESINQLENGQSDKYIISLKYSLNLSANKELIELNEKLTEDEDNRQSLSDEKLNIDDKITELQEEYNKENSNYNNKCGENDTRFKYIQRALESIDVSIDRMINGTFNSEQINDTKSKIQNELIKSEDLLCSIEKEDAVLTANIEENRQKVNKLNIDKEINKNTFNQLKANLDEYYNRYNEIYNIIKSFSMDKKTIFTEEPKNYINSLIAKENDNVKNIEKEITYYQEQLDNAINGTLHLPKSAVDFFERIGIEYQSGASRIKDFDEHTRNKLLENEPLIAFSVIVDDEKTRNAVLNNLEDEWISAIIPVFTNKDISDILEGKANNSENLIAAYCQDFFNNSESYEYKIKMQLKKAQDSKSQVENRINDYSAKLRIIKNFDYQSDFEKKSTSEQKDIEKKIAEINDNISQLNKEINEYTARKNDIKKNQNKAIKDKSKYEQKQETFNQIYNDIQDFEKMLVEISEINEHLKSISAEMDNKKHRSEELALLIAGLDRKITSAKEQIEEYQNVIDETKNTEESEIINETYTELKAKYDLSKHQYSSDRKSLDEKLSECQEEIKNISKRLKDTGIAESEYSVINYSYEELQECKKKQKAYEQKFSEYSDNYNDLNTNVKINKSELDRIENQLRENGDTLLQKSEILDNSTFQPRREKCKVKLSELRSKQNDIQAKHKDYSSDLRQAERGISEYTDPYPERELNIIEFSEPSFLKYTDIIKKCKSELEKEERKAINQIDRIFKGFTDSNTALVNMVKHIREVIDNNTAVGDRYFSLEEKIGQDLELLKKRKEQLDIDLKDVENSRTQLVENCVQRSKSLYDALILLAKNSKVDVFDKSRHMLKIELPDIRNDDNSPNVNMSQYIEDVVSEFLSKTKDQDVRKSEQLAAKYMNMRRLLNRYIGREEIVVRVFKIDKTLQNSKYRTWDNSLKANSGGEKFVVLFSLIISMMNFSRGVVSSLKDTSGVLILDNPFGPISSAHLLKPMFDIAKRFHIQLICFTHLRNADIRKCFSNVYQLKLRGTPLSSVEYLEAEAMEGKTVEKMEYAGYRSEQLSIF